jgi:glycosyltransferase involved in cell wall biosynthesis
MSETGIEGSEGAGGRGAAAGSPAPSPRNLLRLLYVGRVVRSKGVRDAIRALKRLPADAEVFLDVVGDGDDLEQCRREAEPLLPRHVAFHGRLPREDVQDFYRAADVLLFPSFREPSGNVVLEAMAGGLALIVADNGGPAVAVDDSCGIRVTPTTPEQFACDLAVAIQRIANDPSLLRRMRRASRWRAAEVFGWDRKIDWMCELYRRVVFDCRGRATDSAPVAAAFEGEPQFT